MIVLGIHTAGPACDVALVRGEEIVAETLVPMTRGQDAQLPGLVDRLLQRTETTLGEIDRFAVVTGPGSFTGIRVGVAFARGLSLATGAPSIGVTSLEAALPDGQQGSAIVALPAQKRPPDITFWTQTFRTGMPTGEATEMSAAHLNAKLSEHPHLVFGDTEALSAHLEGAQIHAATPTARRAAQFAATLDPEVHPARPTYARNPDAALPGSKTA